MAKAYEDYKGEVTEGITTCLQEMGCQPILFVGSGLSRRYFGGSNWEELLIEMGKMCPLIDKQFAYYKQSTANMAEIGDIFANVYREWAWGKGRSEFDDVLFGAHMPGDIYLKTKVSEYFKKITPMSLSGVKASAEKKELPLLQQIRPHAIITTNYDTFLEVLFPEYQPVIGQKILRQNYVSVGEIFKIHGCATTPDSLVLTTRDYDIFKEKKKYLSAKLFTYFAEHPLVFMGYSAEDENIKSLLTDIDELLSVSNELIPNIYILNWKRDLSDKEYPPREHIISVGKHRTVRINSITANSFDWVFNAFGSKGSLKQVSPKILRSLLARNYHLVRSDLPTRTVEVDFQTLEHAAQTEGTLEKLLGITTLGTPNFNADYPYSLTMVGEELGYKSWHHAKELIERIRRDTGTNICISDNPYHVKVKMGKKSEFHKYSQAAVDLLLLVEKGEKYTLKMKS